MDAMAVFGFFAFLMVIFLWSKVNRLERLLRENGIRPVGSKDLARRLAADRYPHAVQRQLGHERPGVSGAGHR